MTVAVGGIPGQRLDVWLWYARVAKTRTLAQELIHKGKLRVNRHRSDKAAHTLRLGDVVTVTLGPKVRILKVEGFGTRRGPATEAASLYLDLTPEPDRTKSKSANNTGSSAAAPVGAPQAVRDSGAGRPTKRERRALVRLKGRLI